MNITHAFYPIGMMTSVLLFGELLTVGYSWRLIFRVAAVGALTETAHCLKVNATILFVLLACVGVAGFGGIPWIMGVIGDRTDLRTGFSIIPGLFIVLIFVLGIKWRMSSRKK